MNDYSDDEQLFDDIAEDELIKTIAEPILEALLHLQDDLDEEIVDSKITVQPCGQPGQSLNTISLMEESELFDFSLPNTPVLTISCQYTDEMQNLSDDFFIRLEEYLQKRLDEWYFPTVLH